jgi:hypothetical protein
LTEEKIVVIVTGSSKSKKILSKGFYLEQNNPNPFNKQTSIQFTLPYQSRVSIIITNSYGRVVDKIISNMYDAGAYDLEFLGDGLPKGTYFYHVIADKFSDSREMELIK